VKAQVRVLGIDDSPFSFGDERVMVVGALIRMPNYVEAVMRTSCAVDGDDATEAVIGMISSSRYREQMKAVLIDGIALGGFNVVDIELVNQRTGVPCITVTRDRPEMVSIEAALKKHFQDWERRLAIIKQAELFTMDTGHKPLHIAVAGMGVDDAMGIVRAATVRGAMPEPIRIAHLIATAMVEGESRGRA
jgi:endonuclease V-like protein UPF0215 family